MEFFKSKKFIIYCLMFIVIIILDISKIFIGDPFCDVTLTVPQLLFVVLFVNYITTIYISIRDDGFIDFKKNESDNLPASFDMHVNKKGKKKLFSNRYEGKLILKINKEVIKDDENE